MMEKIVSGIVGALVGAVMTYGTKGIQIEGRLDGIERAVIRIEHKIDNAP